MKIEIFKNLIVISIFTIVLNTAGVPFVLAENSSLIRNVVITNQNTGGQTSVGKDGEDGTPGKDGEPGKDGHSVISTGCSGVSINIANTNKDTDDSESVSGARSSQDSYNIEQCPEMAEFISKVIFPETKSNEIRSVSSSSVTKEVIGTDFANLIDSTNLPSQFNQLIWKLNLFDVKPVNLLGTTYLPSNTKLYCEN